MAHEGYHEPAEQLTARTRDQHRAILSLMEELEAVDWYQQRIDVTEDAELRRILEHNRDEEKEHASMVLEWIRRRDLTFAKALKTYMGTRGDVVAAEKVAEKTAMSAAKTDGAESASASSTEQLRAAARTGATS